MAAMRATRDSPRVSVQRFEFVPRRHARSNFITTDGGRGY